MRIFLRNKNACEIQKKKLKKSYLQNLQACIYLEAVEKDKLLAGMAKLMRFHQLPSPIPLRNLVPSGCDCTCRWIFVSKGFYLHFQNLCIY